MADPPVILVHGLWMNGLELSMLGYRLRHEHGYDVRTFSYPTMSGTAAEISADAEVRKAYLGL